MNLEERKEELKRDINKYSKWLEDCKNEYESLKDCVQPKTTELYNGIEKFFSVEKQNGKYEYILGGDGRSQPWSETRSGLIATIKIKKGIYLNTEQKKVIKEYVNETHNPDNIVFA